MNFKPLICIFLFGLLVTIVNSQEIAPNTAGAVYKIPKVNSSIKIDARLDEELWQYAVVVDANIEVSPGENIPAPVKTQAFLMYDDNYIYAGFKCYDPEPEKIRAHFSDRDNIFSDDWILVLFDTFNDNRRTFDFFSNPLGIQADQIESPDGGNGSWDAIWDSHGRITDEGYVVEMAIPFSALGFPGTPGDQVWGFDVVRSYPRSIRHHIGSFPRDRNNNCYMCQAVKLLGFEGAKPGKNIEITPTLSALNSHEREDGIFTPMKEKDNKLDPGVTVKWGITPNMTLGSTINPDFSQVEADIQQLDINTRFALYYSEKRPFFLEGAEIFEMPMNILYTRTLADPDFGAKLTGKSGKNTIGLFTARDNFTNLLLPGTESSDNTTMERENTSTVFRFKRDLGSSSNLGIIATDRESDGYHNRVGGVDGTLKITPKDMIVFQAVGTKTAYPDSIVTEYNQHKDEFDGGAVHFYYAHETKHFELYNFTRQVTPGFRADMGFMSQTGFRYNETGASYKWRRDPGSWYTFLSVYGSFDFRRDYFYRPLHKAYTGRFNYNGPLQTYITLYFENGEDQYEGIQYRANFFEFWGQLKPSSMFELYVNSRMGDQIDYSNSQPGKVFRINPSLVFKPGLHMSIQMAHTYEKLNVDAGKLYTANISRLHLVYQFNKRTFLRTIFQYRLYKLNTALYNDPETLPREKKLFTQILFSYKINPQTVLFLGYSDNYYTDNTVPLKQTDKTYFAKIGYAWRM